MFHIHKTPLAYIELDKNLIIVDWNPAAEEIFGYKKDYSIGKYVNEVIKRIKIQFIYFST
jgi:PAS domain S-box